MGEPPSRFGTVHDSVTDPSPAEATSPVGADGAVAAGVADASFDAGEGPTALTAFAV